MRVGEMRVGEMRVGKMRVGEMRVGEILNHVCYIAIYCFGITPT